MARRVCVVRVGLLDAGNGRIARCFGIGPHQVESVFFDPRTPKYESASCSHIESERSLSSRPYPCLATIPFAEIHIIAETTPAAISRPSRRTLSPRPCRGIHAVSLPAPVKRLTGAWNISVPASGWPSNLPSKIDVRRRGYASL